MSKSAWIHIIFDNACSTLGLWLEKIGGSENFLILICYLGPLVHSGSVVFGSVTMAMAGGAIVDSIHYDHWGPRYNKTTEF